MNTGRWKEPFELRGRKQQENWQILPRFIIAVLRKDRRDGKTTTKKPATTERPYGNVNTLEAKVSITIRDYLTADYVMMIMMIIMVISLALY